MSDSKDDEAKFNETLKRMLDTKPQPHKPTDDRNAKGTPPKRGPKASDED